MNNEYDSGLYGTNLKYFKNIADFNEYITDDSNEKAQPNVAMISDELSEDGVVMTPESNPTVWNILDTAGLIEDGKTALTVDDCAAFTDDDLYNKRYQYYNRNYVVEQRGSLSSSNGCSIFTYYNTYNVPITGATIDDVNIWSFNEFRYFTGITEVCPGFFGFCYGLSEITIPSSVTSIGSDAFFNCINLKKCTIYNTPENVDIYITNDTDSIEYAEQAGVDLIFARNSAFAFAGYNAYNKQGNTDIKWVDPSEGLFTIVYNWVTEKSVITASSNPDVYRILTAANYPHTGPRNGYTASDLASITSITVNHYNLSSLQENNMSIFSFYGNEQDNYDSSTYDTLNTNGYHDDGPNTPNYVQSWTFNEFKYFTGLTELPENCFRNCTTLTEITLPDTITFVGANAFHDCWNIEKFDTQGRYEAITWANRAIDYMSSATISWEYWDDYGDDPTDEHIDYLLDQGIVS